MLLHRHQPGGSGGGAGSGHCRIQRAFFQHAQRGRTGAGGDHFAAARHSGAQRGAHRGQWLKTAAGSREVRGKTLGIIGYGHIGTQVGLLAESLGMQVVFYDIEMRLALGNARPVPSLEALLEIADVVTCHVPQTPADPQDDRRGGPRQNEEGRSPDQRGARQSGGHRRAGRGAGLQAHQRRGLGRLSSRSPKATPKSSSRPCAAGTT